MTTTNVTSAVLCGYRWRRTNVPGAHHRCAEPADHTDRCRCRCGATTTKET